jgi:hypothetical protein
MIRHSGWKRRRLSGGERFLVSLALALALSRMGGKGGPAATLFIEEGFRFLDAASLDLAIDALEGLQSQGRQVGVISHAEASTLPKHTFFSPARPRGMEKGARHQGKKTSKPTQWGRSATLRNAGRDRYSHYGKFPPQHLRPAQFRAKLTLS